MKKSELKQLIKEEIEKINNSNQIKLVTDREKISRLLQHPSIANNCSYIIQNDDYTDIVALIYGSKDRFENTNFLINYMKEKLGKEPIGSDGYEFVEYEDGNENSFTL